MTPTFNTAVFTETLPVVFRSVFTDKGPIARSPLTLREGIGAILVAPSIVEVPVGNLAPDLVGQYIKLIGTGRNDGDYVITAVLTASRLQVRASFSLPDTTATSWRIYDPRTGQIADDPSHVTVRVNGTPVVPDAVIGLLGQIVLPVLPGAADQVEVDYLWVPNPTVDITRLNSKEFRFNNWNGDLGRPRDASGHKYRHNNVLVAPARYRAPSVIQQGVGATVSGPNQITLTSANILGSFVGLTLVLATTLGDNFSFRILTVLSGTTVEVSSLPPGPYGAWQVTDPDSTGLASRDQPQQRGLHYRAYERAYTPVFNDPNLLILNSPTHKIAYPPLTRRVEASFVSYAPTTLPEQASTPWELVGQGSAVLVSNALVVGDSYGGPFPNGQVLLWRRQLDQTFRHAFALAWSMRVASVPAFEGVFTGVGAGYSTDLRAILVGYIEVAGVRKFGLLRQGYGDTPGDPSAWMGGLDGHGHATQAPVSLDWTQPHSYRIYRTQAGVVRVFVDGEVVESLRAYEEDLPYLEDVSSSLKALQQVFWGSVSRVARNQSTWDFVRYQVIPLNASETAPSVFVSYEANQTPEAALPPWTPVGYHGTETIQLSDVLLLEATSATTPGTEAQVGLVGGDFRGYTRVEPLLGAASDVVLDVKVTGRTHTHGIAPDALMVAIDDGDRLTQLSFLASQAVPKFSYGGRSFPTDCTPIPWEKSGAAVAEMFGRVLRITDSASSTGLAYHVPDNAPQSDALRVFSSTTDYTLDFRCQVQAYTPDGGGFVGVSGDIYDGTRTVGILLQEVSGVRRVALHSDGGVKAFFVFDWFDGQPHTYRYAKNTATDLVSLFVDANYMGSIPYSTFDIPSGGPSTGVLSFGSAVWDPVFTSTLANSARSTVDWHYANSWRTRGDQKYYVGLWRGYDPDSLTGYHLPLKAHVASASAVGNVLFLVSPVSASAGDVLIIDGGGNKGVYGITFVDPTKIVLDRAFGVQPSQESFRIPRNTDWTAPHRYRIARTPAGAVAVLLDTDTQPIIEVGYNATELPSSRVGVPYVLSGGLPSISWGAFDPTQLSASSWEYVRYGITRSPTELRIVPHHQTQNQRNVMASPEHLRTNIPHPHTDFWSSSTGIPPQVDPDLFRNPNLPAYTQLNEGTPLVPSTQTSEIRVPTPVLEFVSALNRPEDVLNIDGDFQFNDGATRHRLLVPDDVLYNSLHVIEQITGEPNLIAPFADDFAPQHYGLEWQKDVCWTYTGTTLPEAAPAQPTPWVLAADNVSHVAATSGAGTLTFGTDVVGTRAIYRNATPLTDAPSLSTAVTFRMKVISDGTFGLGDSQIRLGFSGLGVTLALAFVTLPSGGRSVLVLDLHGHVILGGIPFDYLDNMFHTYQIVRNPGQHAVTVSVVS